MRGPHDMGGLPAGPVDTTPHNPSDWDKGVDAMFVSLVSKGHMRVDELRRAIETMGEAGQDMPYYERWCAALMRIVVEKELVTQDEIDAKVASLRGQRRP